MLESVFFNKILLRRVTLNNISDMFQNNNTLEISNHFHFLAASSVVAAIDDEELCKIFNSGISLCDSGPMGAVLRTNQPNFRNIRGSDFLREIIRSDLGTRGHFFILPNESIFSALVDYANSVNPKFSAVGFIAPSFAKNFESFYQDWEDAINRSGAEIIWIGLGSPKQDYIARDLNVLTGKTSIAIGAALEFVSGVKSEAPKIVQALYLEWFFRLLADPRRLAYRYTIGNLKFLNQVLKFWFHSVKYD